MIEAIEILKENNQQFTEKDVARLIKEILIGIGKLNKLNIMHRNIEFESVLIDWNGELKASTF